MTTLMGWLDLGTGKSSPIEVPMASAGGTHEVPVWVRRRSVQISQSRVLTGFFDYLEQPAPKLIVSNCFAEETHNKGAFYGADTDAAFLTAVVARSPCEDPHRVPSIEVYERTSGSEDFKKARAWPFRGKFLALWLSADGDRAILRTERRGTITNTIYDTRTSAAVGSIEHLGSCFEWAPRGTAIAIKVDRDVRVRSLP